jgi:putative ABC transport system permease protein
VTFHLLKLVWRRKRANSLVMIEIFFSFLIVFAVVTMGISMLRRWNAPVGFEWKNIWVIEVENPAPPPALKNSAGIDPQMLANVHLLDRLARELRTMPHIRNVAFDCMTPYSNSEWGSVITVKNRKSDVTADFASDDFARVMHMKLLAGRWFVPEDEAAKDLPIVLDSDAANALFGSVGAAVGQKIAGGGFKSDGSSSNDLRVVGVIPPYRKGGEFSGPNTRMVFFRSSLNEPHAPGVRALILEMEPGTPVEFEAEVNSHLHAMAPDATFQLQRMSQMRQSNLRERFAPVALLAVIALFLIGMVGLGLTGVLWQTVTRRMREIGLRRALGASGSGVRRQVMAEVALLATLAVALGVIIVLQLPLLGIMRIVTGGEFAAGFVVALAVIYGITLLCGAYPSWLASRIEPAEALRYE